MALFLAKDVGLTDIISEDNTNPLLTEHSIAGTTVEVKVYLFNDTVGKGFKNIVVTPIDTAATDESSWIQLAPDNAGSAGVYSSTLSMTDITDDNTGHAFWVKVTTPAVGDTQNKEDLALQVDYKEYAL